MFKKIGGGLFQSAVRRAGIAQQVDAAIKLQVATAVFRERFGDGFYLHAKLKYVKRRVLAVEVVHPAIGEEIRRQEEALLSEINQRLGTPELTGITFLLQRHEEYE